MHALLIVTRRTPAKPGAAAVAYEMLIAGHLAIACCAACEASTNHGGIFIRLRILTVPIEPLLWAGLCIACLGLALAVAHRKPSMAPEIALLALCTPPAINALGENVVYLFIVDAAYFTFRVASSLALDARHMASSVTRLSIIDALDKLPEGIMWTNENRRILYMNDAMRTRLVELGFATDLSETEHLWKSLESIALRQGARPAQEGVRIELPTKQVILFARDAAELRGSACQRMTAVDITEEESANARIEHMNRLLEAANQELRESLAHVQEVAQNEAIVRMKARVHDTIGQRLSILHRFLEAESPSPDALAEVARLTRGIIDDLDEPTEPDSSSQLEAIVQAFSLSGVAVHVCGSLPANRSEARSLVHIVREAATNAVKHAQAQNIDVHLFADDHPIAMTVANDGASPAGPLSPGNGIPGMQRSAAQANLQFRIASGDPFTIEIARTGTRAPKASQENAPTERSGHD